MLKLFSSKAWTWIKRHSNIRLKFPCNLIETIPPYDLTVTRIGVTGIRIRAYWKTHGRLPDCLSDLPILKDRDNSTIDGWGRAIEYNVTGTSTVTLSSSGADGKEGGVGLNQDIIVTFDASEAI